MSTASRVGLVAVIALGGYVGATAMVGGRVKTELDANAAAITQQLPFAKVLEQKYDKGVLSSTRTTRLQLGCVQMPPDEQGQPRPREPLVVSWRDTISHGPLPGLRSVGAASIDSEIEMSDSAKRALEKLFGKDKPLTIRTLVGWDGSTRTQISSPKAQLNDPQNGEVIWSGLSGTIVRGAGKAAQSQTDITIPNLTVKSPQGGDHMIFNQARLHFDGPGAADNIWVSVGKGDFDLASIEMQITPKRGANAGRTIKGTISDLRFHSENMLENGMLNGKGTISGKARFGDTVINQFLMDVSTKNIHATTYASMMKAMMTQSFSCDAEVASPAQTLQAVQADLLALLVHNPEYSMDRMVLDIDGHKGEISYTFGVKDAAANDSQTPLPLLLLSKGYVKGAIKLPLSWLDKMAAIQPGRNDADAEEGEESEGTETEDGTAAASPAAQPNRSDMARMMLDRLAAQGYVVLDQESASTTFSFAQGKIEVNGRPFAMPGMAGRPTAPQTLPMAPEAPMHSPH